MTYRYLTIGPWTLRLERRSRAANGPWLTVGGLSVLSRASDRSWVIASYHPRASLTWHWAVDLLRCEGEGLWWTGWLVDRVADRTGCWNDDYRLAPTRYYVRVSRQDYHLADVRSSS